MVGFSTRHPRLVTLLMVAVTLGVGALIPRVDIDTDPENMLSRDDPVRVFHDEMKGEFAVHDMIVVGVVNEQHADGVFNPGSLRKVYGLTEFARTLRGKALLGGDEAAPQAPASPPPGGEAPSLPAVERAAASEPLEAGSGFAPAARQLSPSASPSWRATRSA